ncbi:MAG: zinc ribbon domain-containing protein [Gemmataceae bacterium]
MPLYEYACKKCEHTFEALVFGNEKVECPECGTSKLEKQMSAPGLAQVSAGSSSSPCGDPSLPPCGAVGCRRTGR